METTSCSRLVACGRAWRNLSTRASSRRRGRAGLDYARLGGVAARREGNRAAIAPPERSRAARPDHNDGHHVDVCRVESGERHHPDAFVLTAETGGDDHWCFGRTMRQEAVLCLDDQIGAPLRPWIVEGGDEV